MSDDPLAYLAGDLHALRERGLLRERLQDSLGDAARLDLCSNDYLGYRSTGRLAAQARQAALDFPPGAGGSRLVTGDHRGHRQLEGSLSEWLGTNETLVFTSGYAANVGVISSLAQEGDLIVSDALNHASIIDGCRLSRAQVAVVPHLSLDAIRDALRSSGARRRWVVTESYFSMDGDGPDLRALRNLCDEQGAALILDEAHALGVLGPGGRGRAAEAGIRVEVFIGTLGKALASQGALASGSRDLCRWLWNRARSFVFSTGLSPLVAAVATAAVSEARQDDAGRTIVAAAGRRLREGLAAAGVRVANTEGPILPVVLGTETLALRWQETLAEGGVRVQAIRPPTVPAGTSRLRLTANAGLTATDLEKAIAALATCAALHGPGHGRG
jgi:8-amino-7-oxononanoate synthase